MVDQLELLGKESTISDYDRKWLTDLSVVLWEDGLYTKWIYLSVMLQNARCDDEQN